MINDEHGLIGCILIEPNQILYKIGGKLNETMFSDKTAAECYRIILSLYDRGKVVDIPAIHPEVVRCGISSNDAMTFLGMCTDACATSTEWQSYRNNIVESWKKRKLSEAIQQYSEQAEKLTANELIATLLTRLEALEDQTESRSRTLTEIMDSVKDEYFTEKKSAGIKTGFYRLDSKLGSLECGDVTIIGARPSVGKSAFAVSIAANVAARGKKVGLFSLEMNERQLYERTIVRYADKLDLHDLRELERPTEEISRDYDKAQKELRKLSDNIVITSGGKTITQIKTECRHMNYDLVIIDYLQLIRSDTRSSNRTAEVGFISRQLKALAMELNVPIIALAQLNRESAKRTDKEPQIDELRDSGDIEQDASVVLLLWHMDETRRNVGVKIAKNRQGQLDKVGFNFDGSHMALTEYYGNWDQFEANVRRNNKARRDLEAFEENPFE